MFGYINPDTPYLFIKDEKLYKAVYCGMCRAIGAGCGNASRSALTYDVAFMSCLLHNIAGCDIKVEKRRCGLHLFRRRFMAIPDEISLLLGCMNTVFAYYKLLDDRRDGDLKGMFSFIYKSGYKRVLKEHPRIAEIVAEQIENQRKLEDGGCAIIEAACEPTAVMLKMLSDYVLGEYATKDTGALMYAIGKWIYLADALDDYDKDVEKGRYNVFYNAFGVPLKKDAVARNAEELNFLFDSIFAEMRASLSNIKFYFNHDLTDNIILRGIPVRTRALVYGKCGTGKNQKRQEVVQKNEQTQS